MRNPSGLSDEKRLSLAKSRTDSLVNRIINLFLIHESNAIVVHSTILSDQVPPSYAAHAFNQFRVSLQLFELLRFCATWDPYGDDRESLPTIARLIDKPEIIEAVSTHAFAIYENDRPPRDLTPSDDTELEEVKREWWERFRRQRAETEAEKARERLVEAIRKIREVEASSDLRSMRRVRDSFVAHNLDVEDDLGRATTTKPITVAVTGWLMDRTIEICDPLHLALNQTSFSWEDSQIIARKNAGALWHGCTFKIER